MQNKFLQYSDYKPSGVEWLGEIPVHWDINPIKYNSYIKARIGWQGLSTDEYIDNGPYLVTGTDFSEGRVNWDICKHVSDKRYSLDPYIQLIENDLLITKDGSIGKTAVVKYMPTKATLNSGVFVIRPFRNEYKTSFLYWVLNSKIFDNFINYSKAGSTISHLYQRDFEEFLFPVPPFVEQQSIAAFLDRQTAKIDKLVNIYQHLIELLQEKRAALITLAVTRGLDPHAPLKHSGVDWLGEIPSHWDINLIKHNSYIKARIGWQGLSTDEYIDIGPYLVTGTDFSEGQVNWDTCKHVSDKRYSLDPYIQLIENDLLITKDGSIGKTAIVKHIPSKATLNSGVFVIRPLKNIYQTSFLYWVLNSKILENFISYSKAGSTISHLYQRDFEEFSFPIPPFIEQQAIAAFLDCQTVKIDESISKIETLIEKLNEYRTALITAAVTGKIDVRGKS